MTLVLAHILIAVSLLALPLLSVAPSAHADGVEMTRIGARTHRAVTSTIESRGVFQVDDGEAFLSSIDAGGMSVRFEYTSTVGDLPFVDGDLIPQTAFTWLPATCKVAKSRKSAKCNDKSLKTFIFFAKTRNTTPTTFRMKAYLRKIDNLIITPNVGEEVRFVVDWTDLASGDPRTIEGIMDRCDWKRGKGRTTKHLKCPTLCGGSPKAICGSSFCADTPKCN